MTNLHTESEFQNLVPSSMSHVGKRMEGKSSSKSAHQEGICWFPGGMFIGSGQIMELLDPRPMKLSSFRGCHGLS